MLITASDWGKLEPYRPTIQMLEAGETIFSRGEPADTFCIVRKGKVEMSYTNSKQKTLVQGYFETGFSFGEPPFFLNAPYPSDAKATLRSIVWRLDQGATRKMLLDYPEIHFALTEQLSRRLMYKSMMLSEIATQDASHRISRLFQFVSASRTDTSSNEYLIPLTRKQIAEMTGLRIETVIRTVRSLEREHLLKILNGKIFWFIDPQSRFTIA